MDLHTPANAVPSVDDTELGIVLDAIRGIHPGLDLIADGYRLIALDRLSIETTQTVLVALAGSPDGEDVLAVHAHTASRLTSPDTNPALRSLGLAAQKDVQGCGAHLAFALSRPDLHQHASNASGSIHTD
jgi:hypothetical protein